MQLIRQKFQLETGTEKILRLKLEHGILERYINQMPPKTQLVKQQSINTINYTIHIVALQEIRCLKNEKVHVENTTVFYSGTKFSRCEKRVSFMVNTILYCIEHFEVVNERLYCIHEEGRIFDLILINGYTRTPNERACDKQHLLFKATYTSICGQHQMEYQNLK